MPFPVLPAPHQVRDKLQPESSNFNVFWMPVADPVISGDQVRHDDFETFYRIVKYSLFDNIVLNFNGVIWSMHIVVKTLTRLLVP